MSAAKRSNKRSNDPKHGKTLAWGIGTVIALVALLALAITANNGVPGKSYGKMYVNIPGVGSLHGHDKVAIGGVRVGQVAKIQTTTNGARVELQLEPGVSLPKDTRVAVRANGLLGARYLQLTPGSSRQALKDGSTINAKQDDLSYGVPDALDTFDKETRGALGGTVTGLGTGVLGNGTPLNEGVRRSSHATDPFRRLTEAISTYDNGDAARQLLPDVNSMMDPLAADRKDVVGLLNPASSGLKPFVDRRESTQQTLVNAPPALDSAYNGLNEGTVLLASVRQLSTSLSKTLPGAPAGLKEVSALLKEAHTDTNGKSPLERTTALLKTADGTVPPLLKTVKALKPLLPRLDEAFKSGNPILTFLAPYGCDIENFAIVARSMTGFGGTGTGPVGPAMQFRVQAVAGLESLGVKEINPHRNAYATPCTNSPGHAYTVTPLTGIGGNNK